MNWSAMGGLALAARVLAGGLFRPAGLRPLRVAASTTTGG